MALPQAIGEDSCPPDVPVGGCGGGGSARRGPRGPPGPPECGATGDPLPGDPGVRGLENPVISARVEDPRSPRGDGETPSSRQASVHLPPGTGSVGRLVHVEVEADVDNTR